MKRQALMLTTAIAVMTSVLTTGVWMAITPASGAVTDESVITSLKFKDVLSVNYVVNPGDIAAETATCPRGWEAIGGGYASTGYNGLTDPSAVSSYPGNLFDDWHVTVANPKLSEDSVSFKIKVRCMDWDTTTVG